MESEKLDRWAEDLKQGLEGELRAIAADLKVARQQSRDAPTLAGKVDAQKRIQDLDRLQREKRRRLFESHDAIDADRERLIAEAEIHLRQTASAGEVFTLRWKVK